jgi:pimeloyl-ACP methyl ester carboxylesterase
MLWILCASLAADPIPSGKAEMQLMLGELPLTVYTYRPANYDRGPLVMVFHGVLRNADEYRDHAVALGDRLGALIVAPKFDEERFPKAKYQYGGIVDDGKAVPAGSRTGALIPKLAAEIRRREQRPDLPYYLLGHSAGGQVLFRSTAFNALGAKSIVAANSGTLTFPRTDWEYPYGLGGLPAELTTDDMLKQFLAQPLTLYLGLDDTVRDEWLDISPEADRQGRVRLERNRAGFRAWQALAKERGWEFRWRIVTADGVDHDHEKMFNHDQIRAALFRDDK